MLVVPKVCKTLDSGPVVEALDAGEITHTQNNC